MDKEFINKFDSKYFNLGFELVRSWADSYPEIKNVLRGLTNECFAFLGDFEQSDEICFAYITYSIDNPGIILKLEYRETDFYYYLLAFCMEVVKINPMVEIIGVYNTFIHHFRTFLEANDIVTIDSSEVKGLTRGILMTPSPTVVIHTFDRKVFYRKCFGIENYRNIEENIEYVYIMMNEDEFTFKIGQSKKPKYREQTLQSKQPNIFLMKVWQCDKKIEKELHKIYKKNRIRGEWFKFNFGELCEIDKTIIDLINPH